MNPAKKVWLSRFMQRLLGGYHRSIHTDDGVYEAEIERLALLSELDYQIERKAAARRLNNIPLSARR